MDIKLDQVSFESDNKWYFKDLSLDLNKNGIFGITSVSKTDRLDFLLDMIYGIYLPTKGKVSWDQSEIYYHTSLRESCFYLSSRWMPPLFLKVKDFIDVTNMSDELKAILDHNKIKPNTKLSHLNARQFFSIYCVQAILEKPKFIIIDFFGASFRSSDEPWVFSLLNSLKENSLIILKLDSTSKNFDFCDSLVLFDQGKIIHTVTNEWSKNNFKTIHSSEKLSFPWIKLPGSEDKYIKRIENLKDQNLGETAKISDVTKLILLEHYQNESIRKAS